jgi:hypothetical protein
MHNYVKQTTYGNALEVQQKTGTNGLVQIKLWQSDTVDTRSNTYAQLLDSGQVCVFPKAKPQDALPLVKPSAELCVGPTYANYTADTNDKSMYTLQLYSRFSNYSTAAFDAAAFELAVLDAIGTLHRIDVAAVTVTVTDSSIVANSTRRSLAHDSKSNTDSTLTLVAERAQQQQQPHRSMQATATAVDAADTLLISYSVKNIQSAAAANAVLAQLQLVTGSTALRYSFSNRTSFAAVTSLSVATTPRDIAKPLTRERGSSSSSVGVIVGCVIGALVVAAAVGCIVYRRVKKHRHVTAVSAKLSPQRKSSLSSMASMKDSSSKAQQYSTSSSSNKNIANSINNSIQSADTTGNWCERRSSSMLVPLHPADSSAVIDDIEQQHAVVTSNAQAPASTTTDVTSNINSIAKQASTTQQRTATDATNSVDTTTTTVAAVSMRTAIMARLRLKTEPKTEPKTEFIDTSSSSSTDTTTAATAATLPTTGSSSGGSGSSSSSSATANAVSLREATTAADSALVATSTASVARSGYTHKASVLVGNMASGLTSAMQQGIDKHGAKAELLWEGIGESLT